VSDEDAFPAAIGASIGEGEGWGSGPPEIWPGGPGGPCPC